MILKKGLIVFLSILILQNCTKRDRNSNDVQRKETEPVVVSVERPKKEIIELVIETTGTLFPLEESNVAFEVDGKIKEVLKDMGDYVRKGEILARISQEEYALKKAQSEADLSNAEGELKRIEELFEKRFATQQQLDITKRNLNVAKAQYDLAVKKLNDCNLRSPISGYISKRMVNAGEYVRTGTVAYYVVNTSILKFKTEVSEKYSGYVKNKDRVLVSTDVARSINGYVMRMGPTVNPDSRAFSIEVRIENNDNLLKPGSFAKGKIFASYKYPALTVSENAVTFFAGIPRVFKIIDSMAVEQTIKIVERIDNRFVIESNLSEKDTIASSLVDTLINNQKVRIKE